MRPIRLLALALTAGQLDPAAVHAYARYRPDPYPRPF